MSIRFALGSVLVLMASVSFAATPAAKGAKESNNYYLNWQERNGAIALDSVCSKNEKGTKQFQSCQKHAQVIFRNSCTRSKDPASKWCVAQAQYKP
ncbi:hypothetical protein [Metapseudomonas furukawaii]|jgi:hypothetical protein|uniref:Uncharacterized protein n=1 Tax=Metapseudomonas furukawaii TaxID=1149133 RepID=A0AAD1FI16_METFU|nr:MULTISPECIES: hypothetical protein [Pseudomonas]ELS26060.1 hypothetical protein ppKF707_2296 [Pseudomonas furukawaii]OWJ96930.1 hypothetical protein B6S59_05625 [Pseudomonas sp. A46]WAG78479.1 hypothetical protein LMK08_24505 [Pseudomonas furukawaii]BAU76767.1 hypothetical protein KF707C_50790 [Pseudomonas furukawaii]